MSDPLEILEIDGWRMVPGLAQVPARCGRRSAAAGAMRKPRHASSGIHEQMFHSRLAE